ncbi:MAG: hypothetical protein IKH18_02510 [Clostridia bacterium]|nr:hypothetical protein [Clostridia bacterium]
MENCLLIGNGLNRCLKTSSAWGELLKKTADRLKVHYEEDISMPLEFERIVNEYMSKVKDAAVLQELYNEICKDYQKQLDSLGTGNKVRKIGYLDGKKTIRALDTVYSIIKADIAARIAHIELPPDAIHRKIPELNPDAVMTTNYEFLLETAFDDNYSYNGKIMGPPKSISRSTGVSGGVPFYHLHGITALPSTICLGFEHYMYNVTKLSKELNDEGQYPSLGKKIVKILAGTEKPQGIWGEKFFTSNIAIIGLGLTECESDIWWLLTQRAYLYYTNRFGMKDYLKNQIVFYDVLDDIEKNDPQKEEWRKRANDGKRKLHKMMAQELITVKSYTIGKNCDSYEDAYDKIILEIKNNGIL